MNAFVKMQVYLSALLSIVPFVKPKDRSAATLLWLPKLMAGALSPILGIVGGVGAVLGAGALGSLLPAWNASRTNVVSAPSPSGSVMGTSVSTSTTSPTPPASRSSTRRGSFMSRIGSSSSSPPIRTWRASARRRRSGRCGRPGPVDG